MVSSNEAGRLVHLPRLDAATGVALATQLLNAAETQALPEGARSRLDAVRERYKVLQARLTDRMPLPADPRRAKRADIAEDAAWSAIASWLEGWMGLIGTPESERAKRLYDTLFPDGLRFTQLPYKLEWTEADARIGKIARDGLDTEFAALGGSPFLAFLRSTHSEYGQALGLGGEQTASAMAELREPLDLLIAAIRSYVFSVVAHAEESGTPELADRVLAPLVRWEARALRADPGFPATLSEPPPGHP